MYSKIVMTGGISLFGRNNLFGKLTRDKELFKFERTNPLPKDSQDEKKEIENWIKEMRNHLNEIEGHEENVSAEYSMIYALKVNDKLAGRPEIVLIHTNTFGGRAAAYLNKEILEKRFNAKVKLDEIKELDITDRIKLNRSLGDFMSLINKYLSNSHKSYTCFAPIGGYKIFSYLGYIVGSFNDLPTTYLHEDRQVLHEIPPVPIEYDETFVEENSEFLRELYIKGIMEEKELDYHQKQLVKENSHFFEVGDGLVIINIFAENFVCKQDNFRHIFGTKVFISEEVSRLIKRNTSEQEFIYQQIRVLTDKIENKSDDDNLNHENTFSTLKDKTLKYHLYKGASNGKRGNVFRCSWKYDDKKRNLYINFVWLDHDVYEREAARGKGLEEEFGEFEEISKEVYV